MKKLKLKLSKATHFAKIKWDAAKHKRDNMTGRFINKPGTDEFKAEPFGPGKTSGIKNTDVIKLHVTANPKKPGSAAAQDFAKYTDDMTVAEFKAAVGSNQKANLHLTHDAGKGFITIHDPATLPVKPPPPPKLGMSDYVITSKVGGVKPTDKIKLLSQSNPKKPGSKAAEDFAKYKDEMTVAEFHAAVGSKAKGQEHILHDMKKGFISIHDPADLGALQTGVKSPGQLAAEMKSGDLKLNTVTPNPFTPGTKNHGDFEATAKKMGLVTPAGVTTPKPPKLADLTDDDIILSQYGTEYKVSSLKAQVKQSNDAAYAASIDKNLETGKWTLKNPPEPTPPQPVYTGKPGDITTMKQGPSAVPKPGEPVQPQPKPEPKVMPTAKLADTDEVMTAVGTKYTVAEYKQKWKDHGLSDAEVINKLNGGLDSGVLTPIKKAAGFADDDVMETYLGNKYTIAEYKQKFGSTDAYIQNNINNGDFKILPKKPEPVTSVTDADGLTTMNGNHWTVGEYKTAAGMNDQQVINHINSGKLKHTPAAPGAAPAPEPAAAAPLKLADVPTSQYSTHDLMLTTATNPYPHASPAWIKFEAVKIGTAGSKTMSIEKYMTTKALTPEEKKATLTQLVDDGHVKIVTPAQKKQAQEQKAKLAQEQAAAAQKQADEAFAAQKAAAAAKFKAHHEQVVEAKHGEYKNDPKWGHAQGNVDPGDVQWSEQVKTKNMMGLKYNSRKNPAVAWYTGSGYRAANKKLRNPAKGYDDLDYDQKSHVVSLDAVTKKQRTQADVVMWRGVNDTTDNVTNMNNIPPPQEWTDGGFTSLSFNPNVSSSFSGASVTTGKARKTMFRVRVPKGTQAAFVGRRTTEQEAMQDEAEVITARGTRYKYISHTRNVDFHGSKVDIIEIEIVNDHGGNI